MQFEKALKISPEDPQANFYLGLALKKLERSKEAIQRFRKALELDSSSPKRNMNWPIL